MDQVRVGRKQHGFLFEHETGIGALSRRKSAQSGGEAQAKAVDLTAESLVGVEVFRRLDAADRGRLAALCTGRRYRAQQRILSHKDPTRDVYFIISGKVRVTIYSLSGKEITFRDQGAGGLQFGKAAASIVRVHKLLLARRVDGLGGV